MNKNIAESQKDANSAWEEFVAEKNRRDRKLLRIKIGVLSIVIILVALLIIFLLISSAQTVEQVRDFLDGKIFILGDTDDTYITLFAFSGETMATERWHFPTVNTEGNLTEYTAYRIRTSILGNEIHLIGANTQLVVYLDTSGSVLTDNTAPPWRTITPEEITELRSKHMCKHVFIQSVTIKASTCTQEGEETRICSLCGCKEIHTTERIPHTYINRVCSVCGQKKDAETSNIKANTWYTYDNSVLQIQNCLVRSAIPVGQGKAMFVQYHAVCQHCHAIDETSMFAGPEVGYEVKKINYCSECKGETLVRLKIG